MTTAWLIEAPGRSYLQVSTAFGTAEYAWTRAIDKALRFVAREQAEALLATLRETSPALFRVPSWPWQPMVVERGV